MKAGLARQITDQMNMNGATKLTSLLTIGKTAVEEDRRVEMMYRDELSRQWQDHARFFSHQGQKEGQTVFDALHTGTGGLTMGYVTKDDCPGVGDDIEHVPVPFSNEQV